MVFHNSKKKALYEVIGRAGSKPGYEHLHPQPEPAPQQAPTPNVVRWVKKPSIIQFNAGRIEFSLPYQVGIAVLLGLLLAVVVVFRLGERVGNKEIARSTGRLEPGQVRPSAQAPTAAEPVPPARNIAKQATSANSDQASLTGKNRIVIKMYQVQSHLEPAKEYFDKLGVATEIIEKNNWYYLVTKNKYDNPDKTGTDGFRAKQKIIELGAAYKAPAGFETFGPKPFSDAFGMRFEE
jgi:hypothetical protein